MAMLGEVFKLTFFSRCGWLVATLLPFAYCLPLYAQNDGKNAQHVPAWTGKELAVIVNDNDTLSADIATYYQAKRNIPAAQVIHLAFPTNSPILSRAKFETIMHTINAKLPNHVQGLVLTWLTPYRVDCMSITTAFATGFDPAFCAKGCQETRHNPYFDSISSQPYTDFGWRPTMVLAANSLAQAKQLIDRGVAADFSNPRGVAYLLKTSDVARSSRAAEFPLIAAKINAKFAASYLPQDFIENKKDVMFYFTGLDEVPKLTSNQFLPGAIADHLTSAGGMLTDSYQMSVLTWLDAGATGSYGAVIEPCNFPAKFSNPAILLDYYLNGSSLIEAYWKSVAQPGQGIFVGEPLAKPFAQR